MGRRKTGSRYQNRLIREVPGSPGYFAGSDGTMWSNKSGQMVQLNPSKTRYGYLVCNLRTDGKCYVKGVHIWVLRTFRGEPEDGKVCRHLDGDRENNHISNLRYGTHSANNRDMVRHGRCSFALLTESQVIAIRDHYRVSQNATNTAAEFGISIVHVGNIVSGKAWQHIPLLPPDPYGINTAHRRGGVPVECQCGHRFYTKAKKIHCGQCKQVEKVVML